jgi:hypothetical protein
MCSIVDRYASDIDITRQDVNLLPWNPDESDVIRKAMKATKKRMKTEKEDKKKEKMEEQECRLQVKLTRPYPQSSHRLARLSALHNTFQKFLVPFIFG